MSQRHVNIQPDTLRTSQNNEYHIFSILVKLRPQMEVKVSQTYIKAVQLKKMSQHQSLKKSVHKRHNQNQVKKKQKQKNSLSPLLLTLLH